jgi:hypothetical protein
VTNRHPAEFRKRTFGEDEKVEDNLKMILFPLKKFCKDTTEVVALIQKIFTNIKLEKDLDNFNIVMDKRKGIGSAIADSIILEPNIAGIGFSFNTLINYFKVKS